MKLNQEQIDIIDNFLEQNKLDFLDFKIEIKDHLASATEALMSEKEISFEEAFVVAQEPWTNELKVKKYWLISNERLFPEFAIRKLKYKVLFHYSIVFFLSIIGVILYSSLKNENHTLLNYIIGFCGIIYFLLRRRMNSDNAKTSYRFHFDYFHLPALMVIAYFFVFQISYIYAHFIGFIIIANFPFSVYYFTKHQQFVKKYQLK